MSETAEEVMSILHWRDGERIIPFTTRPGAELKAGFNYDVTLSDEQIDFFANSEPPTG